MAIYTDAELASAELDRDFDLASDIIATPGLNLEAAEQRAIDQERAEEY